jgi:hypothetical protein
MSLLAVPAGHDDAVTPSGPPSLFPARTTTETTGPRPRDLGSEGRAERGGGRKRARGQQEGTGEQVGRGEENRGPPSYLVRR